MSGFFADYPRFFKTSRTYPHPNRLGARFDLIFEQSGVDFSGARVLDIASHDGRWAFAAVKRGALRVTGVEPRGHLVRNSESTFAHYGVSADAYGFVQADIFEFFDRCPDAFDIVLLLGFFYHTARHLELVARIAASGAHTVIVDTEIVRGSGPLAAAPATQLTDRGLGDNPVFIQCFSEPADDEMMAAPDPLTRRGRAVVGRPTATAVRFLFDHFDYDVRQLDWAARCARNGEALDDYRDGWRGTFVATHRTRAP